jgi:hypothetical protein
MPWYSVLVTRLNQLSQQNPEILVLGLNYMSVGCRRMVALMDVENGTGLNIKQV